MKFPLVLLLVIQLFIYIFLVPDGAFLVGMPYAKF